MGGETLASTAAIEGERAILTAATGEGGAPRTAASGGQEANLTAATREGGAPRTAARGGEPAYYLDKEIASTTAN